ncbi:MAG: C40 family peptidase, partial [Lachnospiraceae bacterium]|nr:C40 family peptidase [Lachnospiraceae bacterium]
CALLGTQLLYVEASSISSIQQQINQNQSNLDKVNSQLSEYEAQLEEYETYLDDMKSEMINLMKDIVYYEEAVEQKKEDIASATADLEEANILREEQYEAMMVHLQYMYESGNQDNYLLMLLSSESMADLLNRAEYIDALYTYDSNVLADYEQTVTEIDNMRTSLEQEKQELEKHQRLLGEQKVELDRIMVELEEQISDYDQLVADAKAKAKAYKTQIANGQKQIETIKKQEEEKRKQEEASKAQQNANNGNQNGSSGSVGVVGSGTGAEIAEYALQFVGNPYVWAGTSLTNGADCSGFIMSVYANFGYSLPHSSFSMRSIGKGVELADAQAGDIICYSGHVALYIGNGQIVHAKNEKYGIVTDPVYYGWSGTGPTVLAVRRIIN